MKKYNIYGFKLGIAFCFFLVLFVFVLPIGQVAYAESVGVFFVVDKNPIERVEVATSIETQEVQRGESVQLFISVFPDNANKTIIQATYEIIEGKKYASIENDGVMKISSEAPIGNIVKVRAVVDSVISDNILTFEIVQTPVESIEFLNNETEIIFGSSISLATRIVPQNATNQNVNYSIIDGNEYAQVSYNGILRFKKDILPDDKIITVRATSVSNPSAIAEKSFVVKQPSFETITANFELHAVEAMRSYSFNTALEPYKSVFGDKAAYYSVDVAADVATIDLDGLLYIKPSAPIGQIINILIKTADGIEYKQELEVVPVYPDGFLPYIVTEPSIVHDNVGYYLPGDIIEFEIEAFSPINTSDINKRCILRVTDERMASVEGNSVKIADNIKIADPSFSIYVYTVNCDENHSRLESEPFEIKVYVSATDVECEKETEIIDSKKKNQNAKELEEGREYNLSDIMHFNILPFNNMACEWNYVICDDSLLYASIKEGNDGFILDVNEDLPAGEVKIGIYVEAKTYNSVGEYVTIVSDPVHFDVYKPTRSVDLLLETTNPVSAKSYADTIIIQAIVSDTASINQPSFTIIQGKEFIEGEIQPAGTNSLGTLWSFKLKQNLNQLISGYKPIKIMASQDGIACENFEINFIIPDEELSLKEEKIERGEAYTFKATHSANTTNNEIEWRIVYSPQTKDVMVSTEKPYTFNVPLNLSAGTEIKIEYRPKDKTYFGEDVAWKTAVYTIKPISNTDVKLVYDGMTLSDVFNIMYGKDDLNVVIDYNNPQLMTGRSTTITVKYGNGGLLLSDFGMHIKNVNISGPATEFGTRTDNTFGIAVNSGAKGNESINISIEISDGSEEPYNVNCGTIYSFRKMSGKLQFDTITQNESFITNYIQIGQGTFDYSANDGVGYLKFQSLDTNGFTIDDLGKVLISSYSACKEQNIEYSYTQYYNGGPIVYKENSTIVLKTRNLNNNGGTGSSYIIAVSNMPSNKTFRDSLPSRANYLFTGYQGFIDSKGNITTAISSSSTDLLATWVKIKYTYGSTSDKTIIDDNVYSYKETIDPYMDIIALKSLGYTKIKITITFDCKEVNDGYQDIRIFSGSDSNRIGDITVEHGAGHKDTSWWSHTITYDIAIDKFSNNSASFYIGWGAHGAFEDTWTLGTRSLIVEAK